MEGTRIEEKYSREENSWNAYIELSLSVSLLLRLNGRFQLNIIFLFKPITHFRFDSAFIYCLTVLTLYALFHYQGSKRRQLQFKHF